MAGIAVTPPPVLEVYYSPTCAPCRLELPALAQFAATPGNRVRMVILDQEARSRAELRAVSPQLEVNAVVSAPAAPRAVLREGGDPYAILPYARVLSPAGNACAHWGGRLSVPKARDLVASCAPEFSSPVRQRS